MIYLKWVEVTLSRDAQNAKFKTPMWRPTTWPSNCGTTTTSPWIGKGSLRGGFNWFNQKCQQLPQETYSQVRWFPLFNHQVHSGIKHGNPNPAHVYNFGGFPSARLECNHQEFRLPITWWGKRNSIFWGNMDATIAQHSVQRCSQFPNPTRSSIFWLSTRWINHFLSTVHTKSPVLTRFGFAWK